MVITEEALIGTFPRQRIIQPAAAFPVSMNQAEQSILTCASTDVQQVSCGNDSSLLLRLHLLFDDLGHFGVEGIGRRSPLPTFLGDVCCTGLG